MSGSIVAGVWFWTGISWYNWTAVEAWTADRCSSASRSIHGLRNLYLRRAGRACTAPVEIPCAEQGRRDAGASQRPLPALSPRTRWGDGLHGARERGQAAAHLMRSSSLPSSSHDGSAGCGSLYRKSREYLCSTRCSVSRVAHDRPGALEHERAGGAPSQTRGPTDLRSLQPPSRPRAACRPPVQRAGSMQRARRASLRLQAQAQAGAGVQGSSQTSLRRVKILASPLLPPVTVGPDLQMLGK